MVRCYVLILIQLVEVFVFRIYTLLNTTKLDKWTGQGVVLEDKTINRKLKQTHLPKILEMGVLGLLATIFNHSLLLVLRCNCKLRIAIVVLSCHRVVLSIVVLISILSLQVGLSVMDLKFFICLELFSTDITFK